MNEHYRVPGPEAPPVLFPVGYSSAPPNPVQEFLGRLFALTPRTPITHLLLAANIGTFVIMAMRGVHVLSPSVGDLLNWGANSGPQTTAGQWWRLATCMFLHGGLVHLSLNMWALYSLGQLAERLFGHTGFLLLYLVTGLGGSLASLYWHPLGISVGASGAICGLFGGLLGYLIRQHRAVPLALAMSLRGTLLSILAINVVIGMAIPGIDVAAHAGGLGVGIFAALILAQPITPEGARRRWLANVAFLAVALPLTAAAASALNRPIPDPVAEIDNLRRIERKFNMEAVRVKRGDLAPERFAQIVEQQILPEWRAIQKRLDETTYPTPDGSAHVAKIRRYVVARGDSFEKLVASIRQNDAAREEAARQAREAADQLIDTLP